MREASRLRSEFLANMSHELRTPLNTVIGYSSIMLDGIYGEVGKKQKETLEKIYHQAFELSKLINDILDLSKMDAGKMPIFKERFRMSQVIKEILLQYRPKIQVKKLKLNLAVNSDLEIESDRSKIKQVMSHIISNAVKFTREGSITISCEKTPAKDHLKISVMDTGIGIDKKSIGKIFDEFRQLDGSHTREYGGTGMGLSISKRILKMLNAKITVKSKKESGIQLHHIPAPGKCRRGLRLPSRTQCRYNHRWQGGPGAQGSGPEPEPEPETPPVGGRRHGIFRNNERHSWPHRFPGNHHLVSIRRGLNLPGNTGPTWLPPTWSCRRILPGISSER